MSSRNLLDQTLSAFRHLSPALVRVGPAGDVHLEPQLVSLDALAFESHCVSKSWQSALDLYHGPFLDGFALGAAPEFERWTERERRRHERSYAAALEGMARAASERADLLDAEKWWRLRVGLEPTSGRAVRALMQTLADAGERALAIEEARKYERTLRIELSVEMDEATVALLRTLQRASRSTPERSLVREPHEMKHADAPTVVRGVASADARMATDDERTDHRSEGEIAAEVPEESNWRLRKTKRSVAAGIAAVVVAALVWWALSLPSRSHALEMRTPRDSVRCHSVR